MSEQTPLTPCRLMIDPPASGAWNMAVDEVLLEWSAAGGGCCWRFYRWEEATLSLGYFQEIDDRRQHQGSRNCPVVRRSSGGGAILHDAELTYSFVVPGWHRLAARRRFLYEAVHKTLLLVLTDLGVQAALCEQPAESKAEKQPFLCFQRRASGDVLVGHAKIAGSAQRRARGAVLQHGSVLLGRSQAAPELDALKDLSAGPVACRQLIDAWLEKLGPRLALTWRQEPLSDDQRQLAAALVETKYGSANWTISRGR